MVKVGVRRKIPLAYNYKSSFFNLIRLFGIPVYYVFVLVVVTFLVVHEKLRLHIPKLKLKRAKKFQTKVFALRAFLVLVATFVIFVGSSTFFWIFVIKDLPSPEKLRERSIDISTKIYDKNGEILYQLYKDKNRTLVKLEDVPVHMRLATLAAEDSDFYNHPGISPKGIGRALYKFAKEGKVTGGSTITQQLVKNALLSPNKTVARKIREVLIALAVEQKYTKDEILEMYLNEVSYGGTAYGVEEASRQYFSKSVKDLSLPEAALLAGLSKSPSSLSPFSGNIEASKLRQEEVLALMEEAEFISTSQRERAEKEEIKFAFNETNITAPHFVMFVRELLTKMYGEEIIYTNGLEVYTTLDKNIQIIAENAIKEEVLRLGKLNVTNGAAIVISPQDGEILAMVGSKDYFDQENDGNVNVVLRLRQPGSSIKVVNYAYALSSKYTPATIIDDSPISFNVAGQEPYVPKNYDGKYRGRITLRSALAESRNIPAVKVLNDVGVVNMIEIGKKMGITSWQNPSLYGLSLTLGGGDITLFELSTVYATLANYGKRPELYGIKKIVNSNGKTIFEHKKKEEQVLDPRVAFMLTDILRDNNARAPAFGTNSALVIPNHREIAVKTGTSNDLRDNLTVGYNQTYLVGVWVGNNNNSPMSRIASGVTGASPIWNKIMSTLVVDMSNHPWEAPAGLVQKRACGKEEWFLAERSTQISCPTYVPGSQNDEQQKQKRE